jgi:hypothetical protein
MFYQHLGDYSQKVLRTSYDGFTTLNSKCRSALCVYTMCYNAQWYYTACHYAKCRYVKRNE